MNLWAADIEDKLGRHVANMHLNKFVSIDNVKLAVTMLVARGHCQAARSCRNRRGPPKCDGGGDGALLDDIECSRGAPQRAQDV
eukprot:1315127-Prymnesium_polylepis.1